MLSPLKKYSGSWYAPFFDNYFGDHIVTPNIDADKMALDVPTDVPEFFKNYMQFGTVKTFESLMVCFFTKNEILH